jgi:hypothetical protein
MCVAKTLADLGEYRGLRVTRNTAGIRYIYLFRLPHTDKLTQITLDHSRSGVEGIYDLAEYLAQIREWLQVWNDHLNTLRPKENWNYKACFSRNTKVSS